MSRAALSAYRSLMRARASLFAGDLYALQESRVAVRSEFEKHRHETDPAAIGTLLRDAAEAEDFLRNNIAQGKLNDGV